MKRSLVESPVPLAIGGFAVPLLLGNLLQQLYSIVDAAIVGRVLGANALAAVGATGGITYIVLGFCIGVGNGFSAVLAKYYGAGDPAAFRAAVHNMLALAAALAFVLTVTLPFQSEMLLRLCRTPEEIIPQASQYLVILLAGIPATLFYNICAGVLYACGNSRIPLLALFMSAILNVLLSAWLILALKMQVDGAAAGTILAQLLAGGFSCVSAVRAIPRCSGILHNVQKLNPRLLGELGANGLSMGLQTAVTGIGLLVMQSAINMLGTAAVAAVTAAGRVESFFLCVYDSLGSAMATFAAQNIGAKKPERIRAGVRTCLEAGAAYYAIMMVMICLLGSRMLVLFLPEADDATMVMGIQYLRITAAFGICVAVLNTLRFTLQGAGFARVVIGAGILEMAARLLVAFAAREKWGFIGACFGHPAAWTAAALFVLNVYIRAAKAGFRMRNN